jgi:hypothetical protein
VVHRFDVDSMNHVGFGDFGGSLGSGPSRAKCDDMLTVRDIELAEHRR